VADRDLALLHKAMASLWEGRAVVVEGERQMGRGVLTNTPLASPVLWRAEGRGLQKIHTSTIASFPSPLSLGAVALQEWSETACEGSPPGAFYHSKYIPCEVK